MGEEQKELSEAESDKVLREELGFGEDDTTINDDSQTDDTTESKTTQEDIQEEESEEGENSEGDKPSWKGKKISKLLHQRNEALKKAEGESERANNLEKELENLKKGSPEYIDALVEQKMVKEREVNNFFTENSEFAPYRTEILEFAREKNLDIIEASAVIIAKNDPILLLDNETRAKEKSKMYNAPLRSSKDLGSKKATYSDEEFEVKASKGEIQF